MHQAFLEAFSDYPLRFDFTQKEFQKKFVQKLNINFKLSPAAFHHAEIVAFIFTSIAQYDGQLTAYNGGTGVIPDFRGQRLTRQLYNFIFPLLKEHQVKQCVLEVLTTNFKAIRAYQAVGFEKSRYFNCFKLSSQPVMNSTINSQVEIFPCLAPDWDLFACFDDTNTSFLDSQSLLQRNVTNEFIVTAKQGGLIAGYMVYQQNGRISRIAVDRKHRQKGIGSAMVNHAFRT